MAELAGRRSARSVRAPRCAFVHDGCAERAREDQRSANRQPDRVHRRHRRRLGREGDRRLPRRSGRPAGDGRLSIHDIGGHLPRPVSREPRDAQGNRTQHAAPVSLRAAHGEPRVSARTPDHGAGAIELVSTVRSQSADVRTQHLLRQAAGLSKGHAANLSRARTGEFPLTSVGWRAVGSYSERSDLLPLHALARRRCNLTAGVSFLRHGLTALMSTDSVVSHPALPPLSDDEELFRDAIAGFAAEEVKPRVSAMERAGKLDHALIAKYFEMGLMGIQVPEQYGGAAGSLFMVALAVEEVSKIDAAAAILIDVQNTLVNYPITR